MKPLLAAAILLVPLALPAQTIHNVGILGNSGEQGSTLVHFGSRSAAGMGVVHTPDGSLWDRGGNGVLNRYSLDGRLLATWTLPDSPRSHQPDGLINIDETLLIKQGRKLYTLPVNATAATSPKLLPVEATHLSFNTHQSWAVAALDKNVFRINLAGETQPITTLQDTLLNLEIGLEGGIYATVIVQGKGQIIRLDPGAPANARGPWPQSGSRIQWLNGHWYGHDHHGTIRRFAADFSPAPGVILGGASGSFIGYVPGNYELESGHGLAHLHGNLYAVSGDTSVLHLLEWQPANLRFEIIRRIGAIPHCRALGLDSEGRVWHHSGIWNWTDAPDAPLQHGVPNPDEPGPIAAIMDAEDSLLLPGFQNNKATLYTGKLDGPLKRNQIGEQIPQDSIAAALIADRQLLTLNPTGQGKLLTLTPDYKATSTPAKDAALQTSAPLQSLTTLTRNGPTLIAAADGFIILFDPTLKETQRWNTWQNSNGKPDQFGPTIYASCSQQKLWVSDRDHHRILCFDLTTPTPKLIATFGTDNQSGNNLQTLNHPQIITANAHRAIVHDSTNQRLVRLELR